MFEWTSSEASGESMLATVPELVSRRLRRAAESRTAHQFQAALAAYRNATNPALPGILSPSYSHLDALATEIRTGNGAALIAWLSDPRSEQYKAIFNMADPETGRSPLGLAILTGQDEAVRLLLHRDAAPSFVDMHGLNAHDLAVQTGNGEAWKLIAQSCPQYRTVDALAATVRLAARSGKASIIERVFSMVCQQNWACYVSGSQTGFMLSEPVRASLQVEQALIAAARYGRRNVVNVLLAQGADLRAQDNRGRDALAHAIRKGHVEVVRVLLAHGARADEIYADGSNAVEMAEDYGQDEVAELLRDSLLPMYLVPLPPPAASAPWSY